MIAALGSRAISQRRNRWRREELEGWLYASPWLLGFVTFTALPMVASLALSFTDWNLLTPPVPNGLGNYTKLLTDDPLVWKALSVTTEFALLSVPLSLAVGLGIALLLNSQIKAVSVWRAAFYLPTVVPGVATALIWQWLFNTDFGLINSGLDLLGIKGPAWLLDPGWIIPSFVLMSLWGLGAAVVVNLAGLQGMPRHLYEAARIDGCNAWHLFRHITVPMLSPVIFYNLVMGVIGSLQVFTPAYVMTGGGPGNDSLFFLLYLYQNAFQWFKMGYASALAWLLFFYILLLTLLVMLWSRGWVYYEGGAKRG